MLSLSCIALSLALVGASPYSYPGQPSGGAYPGAPGAPATTTMKAATTTNNNPYGDAGAFSATATLGPAGGDGGLGGGMNGGHGHIKGTLGPFEGYLGGEAGPSGAEGCGGGGFDGIGATECFPSMNPSTVPMKVREAAPEPTAAPELAPLKRREAFATSISVGSGPIGGDGSFGTGPGAHGHLEGHLGPANGVLGGEVGNGAEGCAGGQFAGEGYTACGPNPATSVPLKIRAANPAPTAAPAYLGPAFKLAAKRQDTFATSISVGSGPIGGDAGFGYGTGAHGHLEGHLGPANGVLGGEFGDGAEGCAGGQIAGEGYTACGPNPATSVPLKRAAAPTA